MAHNSNSNTRRKVVGGSVGQDPHSNARARIDKQNTVDYFIDSPVATASNDDIVRLWDARSGKLITTLEGHGSEVTALALRDGVLAAAANEFPDPPTVTSAHSKTRTAPGVWSQTQVMQGLTDEWTMEFDLGDWSSATRDNGAAKRTLRLFACAYLAAMLVIDKTRIVTVSPIESK